MHHRRALLAQAAARASGRPSGSTETTGTPKASDQLPRKSGLDQVDVGRLAELVALVLAQDPVAAVVDEEELRLEPVLACGASSAIP